jgi:hypothetical protein
MPKYMRKNERLKLWLLAWVSIAQELIFIITFGQVCLEWRANILFSDWMDPD